MCCDCNKRLTVFIDGSFNLLLDGFDAAYCAGDNPEFDLFSGTEDCGDIPPSFVYSLSYAGAENGEPTAYVQRQCTQYGRVREHDV